jgi:hypothetical protein
MKIGLCIGNGLSIDLRNKYSKDLSEFDTYHFLKWDVKSPTHNREILCDLPILKKYLSKYTETNDSFEIVESIIENNPSNDNFENAILLCELQHYIAYAFSTYQNKIDKLDIRTWHWTKWLNYHKDYLEFFVSFNYDLVLEKSLKSAGIKYRRVGPRNEKEGKFILKPHGSIDFEIEPGSIKTAHMRYPLRNAILKNDCEIFSLDSRNLLDVRKEVDIVLPNEYSTQQNYQWIKPGYEWIKNKGYLFTHFIFAGIAYRKCDQEEINFIIDNLSPNTKIIVINPNPCEELIQVLNEKPNPKDFWKDRNEIKNLK